MKHLKKFCILVFALAMINTSNAQNLKFDIKNFEAVVQVFANATFDVNSSHSFFAIGRSHIGFKYKFNDKWKARIILDSGRPTNINEIIDDSSAVNSDYHLSVNNGSYYTIWLKFAQLDWKVNQHLSLRGGMILQNHYITMERFWGLRYVSQTFMDLYWKIPSTDLGIMAKYKFNDMFSLDAAITNGEGARVNQDDKGKMKYSAGLDVIPSDKIQLRFFYHLREKNVDTDKNEQLFSAFAGIKIIENLKLGAEYNYITHINNNPDENSYGFSLYSIYKFRSKFSIFLRYDNLNYNETDEANNFVDTDGLFGGITYSPLTNINFSLNTKNFFAQNNNSYVLLSTEFKI